MKGYKEILLSFVIGLITLGPLGFMMERLKSTDRFTPLNEPTPLQGQAEDTSLSLNWGLQEIGVRDAWRISRGRKDIIIAVIDTGCDVHHPDLRQNIWINPGESGLDENGQAKNTNGLDDDDNGFVDDIHGWNFVNQSPDVMDEHGHGTHIAGIIGAQGVGVAPNVSLMILKYFEENTSGADNLTNTVRAIHYAVRMGAKIINYSGGGILKSSEEEAAIRWASSQGVLFVAAAGNEGLNSDFFHFYPADYDLDNVISVAALDRKGALIHVSNFGSATVDVAAPGKNIYSTLPGGTFGYMTGTSQATAYVSGLAALMLSRSVSPLPVKESTRRLTAAGRPLKTLRGLVKSESIIDAVKAVTLETQNVALEF